MSVRAKFVVNSITRTNHWDASKGELQHIKLTPVVNGSEENKEFYAATPSGTVELATINKAAGDYFQLGKEYFIDFTLAE